MSIDASLELHCQYKDKNVDEIVKLLTYIGWTIFDNDGKITYLPLYDNDEFNWKKEEISEDTLLKIILEKVENQETVGIVLHWGRTGIGISMLFQSFNDILISLNIHRKTIVSGDLSSPTDVNWYVENIIIPLRKFGCIIESYKFEEY